MLKVAIAIISWFYPSLREEQKDKIGIPHTVQVIGTNKNYRVGRGFEPVMFSQHRPGADALTK